MAGMRQVPTRTCVGCGSRDAQASMIRLRIDQPGREGVAAAGQAPGEPRVVVAAARGTGRSAYVHDRRECVEGLARSRGLAKSLRQVISKSMRLDLVESLVERPMQSISRESGNAERTTSGRA
jgi:predicted RNA-binding protein YlxR (DUF448 family)